MFKTFLFDLDGTLVDSLPAVELAWTEWGHRHQIDAQQILSFIHGKQAITSLRHFLAGKPDSLIREEFAWLEHREATQTEGIVPLPGATQLLESLNRQQIPWAIVTSGSYPVAFARYQCLGLPMPDVFITAEKIARGKPEPDPYLTGAQQMGCSPQQCVVVEDASAGVISGLTAGCAVVAVNAPQETPGIENCLLRLTSLGQLSVHLQEDNSFRLSKMP